MNILYVENHAVFADTVRRKFLSHYTVTVVPSLSSAREVIRGTAFDLFLVDYDLDDGKGDKFVRELRGEGNQAIIIGVSSHDEGNAALMRAGANAVCSKMQFDEIQKIIENIQRTNRN